MAVQHASRTCPKCQYGLVTCTAPLGAPELTGTCAACGTPMTIVSSDLPKTNAQVLADLVAQNQSLIAENAGLKAATVSAPELEPVTATAETPAEPPPRFPES